mgnify:CR=1 FL=1
MCNMQYLKTFFIVVLFVLTSSFSVSAHSFASLLRLVLIIDKVIFNKFFKAIGKRLLFFSVVVKEYNLAIRRYCYWITCSIIRENKTIIYFGEEIWVLKRFRAFIVRSIIVSFPIDVPFLKA